ncbi:hypothetical protein J6590_084976 [Homalodisca vitripennis]|nr:hypothetical protein J6590_084976 [Homalodisca vitripennis]
MDSDDEHRNKSKKLEGYSLHDLVNLRDSKADKFLFNITDDMAENSSRNLRGSKADKFLFNIPDDMTKSSLHGGDSEADDEMDFSPSTVKSSTPIKAPLEQQPSLSTGTRKSNRTCKGKTSCTFFSVSDEESDYINDTDADSNYEPSNDENCMNHSRLSLFNNVSLDESVSDADGENNKSEEINEVLAEPNQHYSRPNKRGTTGIYWNINPLPLARHESARPLHSHCSLNGTDRHALLYPL